MACVCGHSEAKHDPPGRGSCTYCRCHGYQEKFGEEPEQDTLDEAVELVRSTPLPGTIEHHIGAGSFARPTIANRETLQYVLEHDREDGVAMAEIIDHFNMSVFQQGHLALAMKDAVKLGYAERVSPPGAQYRWRVTAKGREVLS